MAEQVAPDLVIHLVHGTFAKGASWMHEDSALCKCLKADAGGTLEFQPFNWSGGNSHDDRLEAGIALASHLRRSIENYPGSNHFIIAHSHGGNVSLYAMRDPDLEKKISGIVCLGTPFIHCRARAFQAVIPLATFGIIGLAVALAVSIVFHILGKATTVAAVRPYLVAGDSLAGWAAIFAAVASRRGFKRLRLRQQAIIDRLSLPAKMSCPVCCLDAVEDEAAKLLRTLCIVSNLPFLIGMPVLFFAPALLIAVIYWQDLLRSPLNLVLAAQIGVVCLIALYPTSILIPRIIHAEGFGGETIMDNWLVRIFIRPEPPDISVLTQRRYFFWTVARLGHSTLYQKDQVLRDAAKWIKTRAANELPEGAGVSG